MIFYLVRQAVIASATAQAAGTLGAMERIRRGWVLTRESWAVVRADRSLLAFPAVSAVCAIVVAAVFFGLGAGVGASSDSVYAALPFLVIGVYLLIVVGQFAAVALTACATASLDGKDTTFGEGVRAARERLGVIFAWAAVQLVVGALISALQAALREGVGNLVGSIVGGIANATWSVTTFFVVPIIALEGVGPREAIKRSAGVIRERWGEGVVGSAAIGGTILLLGILPGVALVIGGAALAGSSVALGGILVALGVVVVVLAALVQITVSAVFRVALYRFATQGDAPGHFSAAQLGAAFQPRRRRRFF